MPSQLKDLFEHSLVYAFGSLLQRLSVILLLPLYTRVFTTSEFGMLDILNSFTRCLILCLGLGFPSALTKCYYRDCENANDESILMGTSLIFVIVFGTFVAGIVLCCSDNLSELLFGKPTYNITVSICIVGSLFNIIGFLVLSMFRTWQEPRRYVGLSAIQFLFIFALNLYFLEKLNLGLNGVFLAFSISWAVISILSLRVVLKRFKFVFSPRMLQSMFKFGVVVMPVSLGMWIVDLSDRYFLNHFADLHEVGLYALGYKFGIVFVVIVVTPFQLAWPPFYFSTSKEEDASKKYSEVFTVFSTVIVFVGLSIVLISKPVIRLIAPPDFYGAHKVVPLVVASYVFYGIYFCFHPGIHLRNKSHYFPFLVVFAAVLNILLNYLLIPQYGMMGAAVATASTLICLASVTYVISNTLYRIKYEWRGILQVGFAACAVYYLSTFLCCESAVIELLCKLLIAIAFPLALYLTGFFSGGTGIKMRNHLEMYYRRAFGV